MPQLYDHLYAPALCPSCMTISTSQLYDHLYAPALCPSSMPQFYAPAL